MVAEGRYSPVTMNTDLSVLRVVMTTAKIELGLITNPAEALAPFDTSQHPSYTFEEPNSLTVNELRTFSSRMRESFPAHYAMTFLGFALGKRPSTTRPLRRRGPTPDILWETGVMLFRRSNTYGQIVMEGVKTGGEERVQVPEALLEVLRWHVETQLRSPAQQHSDLLFPALHGGSGPGTSWTSPSRRSPERSDSPNALPLAACVEPSKICAARQRSAIW
jgi:hypothetical protein